MASEGKEVGDGKLDVPSDQASESFQLDDLMAQLKPCKLEDSQVSPAREKLKPGSSKSGDGRKSWLEIVDLQCRLSAMLHKRGYVDGERLSPADEKLVRDVLKYHKKCEEKTGPGIDYIKIQKVYDLATRCFWIVRVDGTEIDFSYHKCLMEKAAEECPDMLDTYDALFRPSSVREQAAAGEMTRTSFFDIKTRHKYLSFS